MKRTQIQLTEELAEFLEKLANERGVSKAQIVRDVLEKERQQSDVTESDWDRLLNLAGKYESGRSDVSESHDKELANIYNES